MILDGKQKISIQDLTPLNKEGNNLKDSEETISNTLFIGGNLTIVQSSIGTDWQIRCENKVLFLEDISEKGYEIDRQLHHLDQAGIFDQVKAIIFGTFEKGDEHVQYAINNFAHYKNNIPIFRSQKIGHGRYNTPIMIH